MRLRPLQCGQEGETNLDGYTTMFWYQLCLSTAKSMTADCANNSLTRSFGHMRKAHSWATGKPPRKYGFIGQLAAPLMCINKAEGKLDGADSRAAWDCETRLLSLRGLADRPHNGWMGVIEGLGSYNCATIKMLQLRRRRRQTRGAGHFCANRRPGGSFISLDFLWPLLPPLAQCVWLTGLCGVCISSIFFLFFFFFHWLVWHPATPRKDHTISGSQFSGFSVRVGKLRTDSKAFSLLFLAENVFFFFALSSSSFGRKRREEENLKWKTWLIMVKACKVKKNRKLGWKMFLCKEKALWGHWDILFSVSISFFWISFIWKRKRQFNVKKCTGTLKPSKKEIKESFHMKFNLSHYWPIGGAHTLVSLRASITPYCGLNLLSSFTNPPPSHPPLVVLPLDDIINQLVVGWRNCSFLPSGGPESSSFCFCGDSFAPQCQALMHAPLLTPVTWSHNGILQLSPLWNLRNSPNFLCCSLARMWGINDSPFVFFPLKWVGRWHNGNSPPCQQNDPETNLKKKNQFGRGRSKFILLSGFESK